MGLELNLKECKGRGHGVKITYSSGKFVLQYELIHWPWSEAFLEGTQVLLLCDTHRVLQTALWLNLQRDVIQQTLESGDACLF